MGPLEFANFWNNSYRQTINYTATSIPKRITR